MSKATIENKTTLENPNSFYAATPTNIDTAQLKDSSVPTESIAEQKIDIEVLNGRCEKIQSILNRLDPITKISNKILEIQTYGKVTLPGLSTNYKQLDDCVEGLQKECFYILGARPGMGKSWFALNFLVNIAIKNKIPVALFSLEMSYNQLINRLISLQSNVPLKTIQNGTLSKEDFDTVKQAVTEIEKSPIFISDDSKNSTLANLEGNVKKAHKDDHVKFIIIDHIGLISTSKTISDNRVTEVGKITRAIKLAAKELKVPIMGVAQLNREAADNNAVPLIKHLRESGAIEQDADVIMFLHQPNKDEPHIIELTVPKNRNGEQGQAITFTHNDNWRLKEKGTKEPDEPENEYAKMFGGN